ncbi:hypothetical protein RvY_17246 [Ramazzottius varieornatus]|uniref:Major facilitator superfamily (MFS) profile domain-containing protein n=1 Tax=Ramazzottius varieornatus TaxID=947166 RepID=A0A1D1W8L6_RAMVA|nr:hypothetical protein RvY_17246 [Ramazzottius varieornatus]
MNGGAEYVDVDEVLAILGNPGPFQIIQFIFLSSIYLPLSINDYVVIFFGIAPLFVSCSSAPGDHNLYHPANSTSVANFTSFNITPWNSEDRTCSCPDGFEYVYPGRQWSIIGDMDLVCDKSPLVNLATVIYFLGWVIASPISGWATDHFGRRPTLFVSYGVYTVSQIGLIFSRDYISFTLLRFTVGSARQIMNTAFFVLMMEWIPPNKRVLWGTFSENQYNMGLLLTALIGFLLQNWIHIQIFIAVFCVTAVPLFW